MKRERKLVNSIPELMIDWDAQKNNELNIYPETESTASRKKVYWKCHICNNEWSTTIDNRYYGKTGCPKCSLKKKAQKQIESKIKQIGSLADNYPELIDEWDYEENKKRGITPQTVLPHSEKKAIWKCKVCGYKYEMRICNKTIGAGCPKCIPKLAAKKNISTRIKKYGSFADNFPELLEEWNYEENDKLNLFPDKITSHSEKKAYWNCPTCGNIYKAQISHRTNGTSCPKCSGEFRTSFPEQAIYYYLKKYFKDVQNRFLIEGKEIDIYIPKIKVGIEYDGKYFHQGSNSLKKEQTKYNILKSNGIKLIRVKESNHKKYMNDNADYFIVLEKINNNKALEDVINNLLNYLKIIPIKKANIYEDRLEIYKQYISTIKENSFEKTSPELLKEWNYAKNNPLRPNMISKGSSKKVWWICSKKHEWEATIPVRIKGHGCPYCAGQKAIKGENDLVSLYPEIVKEWDYTKNKTEPSEYMPYSNKKVWWVCKEGHSFEAFINDRIGSKKEGCPICSGKKVLEGFNDLASKRPDLLKEWDFEENGKRGIFPNKVTYGSQKKVNWICNVNHNHKWSATIQSRARRNMGCPICKNKIILEGDNDFKSNYPELLKEWNYDKNVLQPEKLTKNSTKKVWWKCQKCGNEWQTSIYQRTILKQNCPKCASIIGNKKNIKTRIIKSGSFADNYPELLKEWDYEENNKLGFKPNEISCGSHNKVWWRCPKNHKYQAIVKSRTRGTGCPYCSNRTLLTGYNDLATVSPHLLQYWDYEKNQINPTQVLNGSDKEVFWKCDNCGNKWKSRICNLTQKNRTCPKCGLKEGENKRRDKIIAKNGSLYDNYSELMEEWILEKNDKDPRKITKGSDYKAWWKCRKCGYIWQTRVSHRTSGHGCPNCKRKK